MVPGGRRVDRQEGLSTQVDPTSNFSRVEIRRDGCNFGVDACIKPHAQFVIPGNGTKVGFWIAGPTQPFAYAPRHFFAVTASMGTTPTGCRGGNRDHQVAIFGAAQCAACNRNPPTRTIVERHDECAAARGLEHSNPLARFIIHRVDDGCALRVIVVKWRKENALPSDERRRRSHTPDFVSVINDRAFARSGRIAFDRLNDPLMQTVATREAVSPDQLFDRARFAEFAQQSQHLHARALLLLSAICDAGQNRLRADDQSGRTPE